jgi:vacuolar-type H+-ATPase subunit E/Vma4
MKALEKIKYALEKFREIETEVRKIPQQTNEVNKIKTLVREGIQTLNDERARPNTTKNL